MRLLTAAGGVLLLMLPGAGLVPAQDPGLGPVTEQHVWVPMRDGVRLSMYLYLPKGSRGPWPVLYEQRYASLRSPASRQTYARLAAHGYAVAAQNFRGTQQSEGVYNGYRSLGWGELRDGYDTVEWLARQPWSNGKIGTFGSSQAGYAQNFLAVTQPPHLVAQYMVDTGLSLFHLGYRIGGITRPKRFEQMAQHCRNAEDNVRWLDEMFRHPTYDGYWQDEDCTRHFDKMNVPAFTVGSWYDFMSVGSIESYVGRQHRAGPQSRGRQQLMLGPWLHGGNKLNPRVGELGYPGNAAFALYDHLLRWFDYHLKGQATGVEQDPAVRYYVMGAVGVPGAPGNEWRTADDWPVAAERASYYLHEARLSTARPDSDRGQTAFLADPLRPAPIPGMAFPGARDARSYEQHPDVRTFTSEVLREPVEWTGKVEVELWISSTAPDTDVIARVSDVYPDGRSILIIDSIRRARFREGFEREKFMTPGRVERFAFDVGWLSQVFNRGHRIRLTVGATGADFYEPNPNTGGPMTRSPAARMQVARNTVHHNRRYASRLIAPVRGGRQNSH